MDAQLVVKCFVAYLERNGTTHYEKLVKDLRSVSLVIRNYFSRFTVSDQFWFFKEHSAVFDVGSNGYVSLCLQSSQHEQRVVTLLVSAVQQYGQTHYVKLVHLVSSTSADVQSYFATTSPSQVFWFFKSRDDSFVIDGDGFVSLPNHGSETSATRTDFAPCTTGGGDVIDFLTALLKERGKMHCSKLCAHVMESGGTASKFFVNFTSSDMCGFFRDHPSHFTVSSDGCVSLPQKKDRTARDGGDKEFWDRCVMKVPANGTKTVAKSPARTEDRAKNESKSGKEQKVIDFLVSVLENGSMHYLTLLDLLVQSPSDVRSYFSQFSPSEKQNFFKNRPTHFVMSSDGYVSKLQRRAIPHPPKHRNQEQEAIEYFVSVLKNIRRIHYTRLAKSLSDSTLDINNFFINLSPSEIHGFFKNRPLYFDFYDDGNVSLTSNMRQDSHADFELSIQEAKVIGFLTAVVKHYGAVHYLKLINILHDSDSDVKDYFVKLTHTEKYSFFKDRPLHFALLNGVNVSLPSKTFKDTPVVNPSNNVNQIVDFFVSTLLHYGALHYLNLFKCLENSTMDVEDRFTTYTISDKLRFFKGHPNLFITGAYGYVSLVPEIVENRSNGVQTVEQKTIEFLVSSLRKSGELDYASSYIREYFADLTTTEIYWFFKDHPSYFVVGDNCSVSLVSELAADFSDGFDEGAVVDFLALTLSECGPMHYLKLCDKCGSSPSPGIRNFFLKCTEIEKLRFFSRLPSYFVVSNNSYVSLSSERTESASGSVDSHDGRPIEEKMIEFFVSTLRKSEGKIHHRKLIRYAVDSCAEMEKYFDSFTSSDKHWFFKRRPSHFLVGNDGYVSLSANAQYNELSTNSSDELEPSASVLPNSTSRYENSSFSMTSSDVQHLPAADLSVESGYCVKEHNHSTIVGTVIEDSPDSQNVCTGVNTSFPISKHLSSLHSISEDQFIIENVTNQIPFGCSFDSDIDVSIEHDETCSDGILAYDQTRSLKLNDSPSDISRSSATCLNSDIESFSHAIVHESLTEEEINQPGQCGSRANVEEYGTACSGFMSNNAHCDLNDLESQGAISLDTFTQLGIEHICKTQLEQYDKNQNEICEEQGCSETPEKHTNSADCHVEESRIVPLACNGVPDSQNTLYSTSTDSEVVENLVANREIPSPECGSLLCQSIPHSIKRDNNVFFDERNEKRSMLHGTMRRILSFFRSPFYKSHPPARSEMIDSGNYVSCNGENLARCIASTPEEVKASACHVDKESRQPTIDLHTTIPSPESSSQHSDIDKLHFDSGEACPDVGVATIGSDSLNSSKQDHEYEIGTAPFIHKHSLEEFTPESSEMMSDSANNSEHDSGSSSGLSLTNLHVQSVMHSVVILETLKSLHYKELLNTVRHYDEHADMFFSAFTLPDVLKFLQLHFMYFQVESDGTVALKSPSIEQVFDSKEHVMLVTSLIEAEAVEFYIGVLEGKKIAEFSDLECYLGNAPGYVVSFFIANYCQPKFPKFFRDRPSFFCVFDDRYVKLATKAKAGENVLPSEKISFANLKSQFSFNEEESFANEEIESDTGSQLLKPNCPEVLWCADTSDSEDCANSVCPEVASSASDTTIASGVNKTSINSVPEVNLEQGAVDGKFLAVMERCLRNKPHSTFKCYEAFFKILSDLCGTFALEKEKQQRIDSNRELNNRESKIRALRFYLVVISSFPTGVSGRKLRKILSEATEEVRQYFATNYECNILDFFENNPRYFSIHRGKVSLKANPSIAP